MKKARLKRNYQRHWWASAKEFDLSPTEALTQDLIDGLSRRKGWSYASKGSMAKEVNVTTQTIHNMIKKLMNNGLIEEHPERLQPKGVVAYRPTKKWKDFINKLEWPDEYEEEDDENNELFDK